MKGLYAIGEVASTGVHGANRLASNSLLEGLVFARRATEKVLAFEGTHCRHDLAMLDDVLVLDGDKAKKDGLRRIMWENVSIVRTHKGLLEAKDAIESMLSQEIGRLLKLRLLTAKSIVDSALERKTSMGAHYIS